MTRCAAFLVLLQSMAAAAFAEEAPVPDSSAPAHASMDEQSKAAFEAGARRYERGEFRAAAESFRVAHELSPQPALLYNLAQAERLDGQCELAVKHYQEFVATYSGSVPADIDEKIAVTKRCADGRQSAEPTAAVVLKAEMDKPAARTITAPAPSTDGVREPAVVPRWLGWIAAGVGAAGLIAGGVMAVMVSRRQSQVEDICPDKQCRDRSGLAAASEGKRLLIGSIAAFGLGAAGLGVTIYVWTRDDSRTRVESSLSSLSGAVVTVSGAF